MPLKNREKPDRRAYVDMPYDVRDKEAEMRAATSYVPRKSSRNGATVFNITVFFTRVRCGAACGARRGRGRGHS